MFCFTPLIDTNATASLETKIMFCCSGNKSIVYFGILAWISIGIKFCFHWRDNHTFDCYYVSSKKKVNISVKINTK